jgi:DNA-binding winged helix-turn-helix (wHTH) protein
MRDATKETNIGTSDYQGLFVNTSSRKVFVNENLLNSHISVIKKTLKQVDEQVVKYIITEKCYGYRLGEDYFTKD